jgi:hypothetical protein
MIAYSYEINKSGDVYSYSSDQFPTLTGFGHSEHEASNDFWNKMLNDLNSTIRNGARFPEPVNDETIRKEQQAGKKHFKMPAYMALKMYLHTAMLNKKVARGDLARMLALTSDEVKPDEWKLEHIRSLKPAQPAKSKKVQRLLDIKHDSLLNEISEAFRIIDHSINFAICPKGFDEWEPLQFP